MDNAFGFYWYVVLYLLGIDGGLNNLGYAICEIRDEVPHFIKFGTVHAEEKDTSDLCKLNFIGNASARINEGFIFGLVAVEFHKAERKIEQAIGAFLSRCEGTHNALYINVPVVAYKKGIGINTKVKTGIPSKDEVQTRLFVLQTQGLISGLPASGEDHTYDAIAVVYFAYRQLVAKVRNANDSP